MIAGKYRIVRKVGSGSFGDIYLGINITNGEVRPRFRTSPPYDSPLSLSPFPLSPCPPLPSPRAQSVSLCTLALLHFCATRIRASAFRNRRPTWKRGRCETPDARLLVAPRRRAQGLRRRLDEILGNSREIRESRPLKITTVRVR